MDESTGQGGVPPAPGALGRAAMLGFVGVGIGLVFFLIASILFLFTAGLVVIGILIGRFAGLFVRAGAEGGVARPTRAWLALALAVGAIVVGNVLSWLWALHQGGVLPFADYLAQTYGAVIIGLEVAFAGVTAWFSVG